MPGGTPAEFLDLLRLLHSDGFQLPVLVLESLPLLLQRLDPFRQSLYLVLQILPVSCKLGIFSLERFVLRLHAAAEAVKVLRPAGLDGCNQSIRIREKYVCLGTVTGNFFGICLPLLQLPDCLRGHLL